uniref:Uncharacterized protein n=1 Tax=Xiphophorus couchianus TaxID=32473 RepID=A0A3B5N179_9TELE
GDVEVVGSGLEDGILTAGFYFGFGFHHLAGVHVSGKAWITPKGFDTGIKTFNSLTKQKEALILAREGTLWTYMDLNPLLPPSSYVRFDILQRILTRVFGVTVIHAMVITDIDDKIIRRSWEVWITFMCPTQGDCRAVV